MKSYKIRTGQSRNLKDGTRTSDASIQIPPEHMKNLGWVGGDSVIITSDKLTGELVIKKFELKGK